LKSEIRAEKKVLMDIFDKLWFLVPEYQRSYIWETENVNELLEDLSSAYEKNVEGEYFLGSLVLKKTDESKFDEYELLDGQQRLTTFLLLLAVIRDLLEDQKHKLKINGKIQQEEDILEGIPARERIKYKIRDDVEEFMRNYVLENEGTKKVNKLSEEIHSSNLSIHHMRNAILTISDFFGNYSNDELTGFVSFVLQKALFISVSTDDTEDAFRLFTILNNRGLPLTTADILKSMNIGALENDKAKSNYARKWEEIEEKYKDFDRFLYFVRNILAQDKPKEELLKEFERLYNSKVITTGKEFLDLIINYDEVYQRIIELEDEKLNNEFRNLITIMKKGFQSDEWISPILFYFQKYRYENLNDFLRYLEYKFFSEWICGNSPNLRRDRMNAILKAIAESNESKELFRQEELFYVSKNELENALKQNVYLKNFKRYVLLRVEYLLQDNSIHMNNYEKISIEHVLPQNPNIDSKWVKIFTEKERDKWINKLSNLVLINRGKNSKLSNLDFKEKKLKYLDKGMDIFASSKVFSQIDEWNVTVLENREKKTFGTFNRKTSLRLVGV
jgi:uncharacterized protein with ParB-like and HNH nuclease domain